MVPLELIREFERQMKALRIGNTSMKRAQKLEKKLGIRRLHLKLEGDNPSGTHKDRAALIHALDARKQGFTAYTAVSCGNYGAALAYVAEKLSIDAIVYVPKTFSSPRKSDIISMGGKVVEVDGGYEDALKKSAEDAYRNHWYNANPGGDHKELGLFAYMYIAKEIAKDLGRHPDWVSVPVGNGTCIGGIWRGFQSMSMKPRMLGVSNNNSAIHGLALGAKEQVMIPELRITEINEPLADNFLTEAEEVIGAVVDSNGAGVEVPDEELVKASKVIMSEEGLDILPASAGAVWGISQLDSRNHVFVAVLTGKGHPSKQGN